MLDRYAQKDRELRTLGIGDIVLTVIKEDPKYPARGVGVVKAIDWEKESVTIEIEEEFRGTLEDEQESITGIIRRPFAEIDKPMEICYEQIARPWSAQRWPSRRPMWLSGKNTPDYLPNS